MTDDRIPDGQVLAPLDPVRGDPAPARGSFRYLRILETTMVDRHPTATHPDPTTPAPRAQPAPRGSGHPGSGAATRGRGGPRPVIALTAAPPRVDRRSRPSRRRVAQRPMVLVAVGVAASVLAVMAVVAVGSADRHSAAATVTAAAENISDVTSLRASLTRRVGEEPASTSTAEVDGTNIEIRSEGDEGPMVMTIVGDTVYETLDGETTAQPYDPQAQGRLDPFGASSAAVVTAALEGSQVDELGSEPVRTVESTHYRVSLDDAARQALGSLPPSTLAWFDLEYPDTAETIDVWVADELIRRIRITTTEVPETATTEFYDFNAADIAITAPQ